MSKKFPDLRSDEGADAWLQSADLSEYDLSGMKKVRFELRAKTRRSACACLPRCSLP
jgi:hypothetical protein